MEITTLRRSIKKLRRDIPGLVSFLILDRDKNLLLYGESDDITSPLGEIASCYSRLAHKIEKAHACRKASLGKSVKCMNIVSLRMVVSLRTLSEKHLVVTECMSQKSLGFLAAGVSSLAKILRGAKHD